MANLYNCTIETFVDKQYVQNQTVHNMTVAEQTRPQVVDQQEPLSYYIPDAELRQRVIDTARNQCSKADHVKKLIFDILVREGYDEGMLRSGEFLKRLIPHLVQMPHIDVAGLQRAFRENKG